MLSEQLFELRAKVFCDDEAYAARLGAMAGMAQAIRQCIAVVKAEFFAKCDVFSGDDPDAAAFVDGFAVVFAAVVDVFGYVVRHIAVEIIALVELEDVHHATFIFATLGFAGDSAAMRFGLGDLFAGVFDDIGALGNVSCGEDSTFVDG